MRLRSSCDHSIIYADFTPQFRSLIINNNDDDDNDNIDNNDNVKSNN